MWDCPTLQNHVPLWEQSCRSGQCVPALYRYLYGTVTSLLFKQFSMVCISLAVSLHQLYTLEMYQRDARLRKMKKSMLRMKRRIDRLERRIGGDGDV